MAPPQFLSRLARWAVPPAVLLVILGIAQSGAPAPPRSNPAVSVKMSPALYRADEPVAVVITNVSRAPVTMLSGGFFCTVVRLEQRTAQGWHAVDNCFRVSVPIPETLGAGATKRLTFPIRAGAGGDGFPRGTFRFAVIFEVEQRVGGEFVAHSDPFTVR